MEVTKTNFDEGYEMACKSIDDAGFLSFDTELTGLGKKGENEHSQLDTLEERYAKTRNDVKEYTMIQFGLSTFKFDFTNKRVQTATYCFYLSGQTDASYRYDSASMEFLATNGFNFNKLFKDGLPFMSLIEEVNLRKKAKYTNSKNPLPIKTTESQNFFSKTVAKLQAMKNEPQRKMTIPYKSLSSFHRKLMFTNITIEFPSYLIETVDYCIEITPFRTVKEKEDFLAKRFEVALQKKIAFGLIGRKIMEAKKPIVGHNPHLDVFHFVDKLVAALPELYSDFKTLASANLPVVYDTKLIVGDPPFVTKILNSSLNNVYEELHTTLFDLEITTELGCKSYSVGESIGPSHNAGYDAFMTGICFLAMMKKLSSTSSWMKKNPLQLTELTLYANRIHMMFSHDIPYFDLTKDEPIQSRSHIFAVECPENWNNDDIKKCFSNLRFYKTVWLSDTKLYVIPQEPASLSLSEVTCNCPPDVFISMYQLPVIKKRSEELQSNKVRSAKHSLDNSDNLVNLLQTTKRLKNEESVRMSAMSLDPSTDKNVQTIKNHFAVNTDWN